MDFDTLVAAVSSTIGILFFWFEFSRLIQPARSMKRNYPAWFRDLLQIPESKANLTHVLKPNHIFTERELSLIFPASAAVRVLLGSAPFLSRRIVARFFLYLNLFVTSAAFYALSPSILYNDWNYNRPGSTCAAALMFLAGGFLTKMIADVRIAILVKRIDMVVKKAQEDEIEKEREAAFAEARAERGEIDQPDQRVE